VRFLNALYPSSIQGYSQKNDQAETFLLFTSGNQINSKFRYALCGESTILESMVLTSSSINCSIGVQNSRLALVIRKWLWLHKVDFRHVKIKCKKIHDFIQLFWHVSNWPKIPLVLLSFLPSGEELTGTENEIFQWKHQHNNQRFGWWKLNFESRLRHHTRCASQVVSAIQGTSAWIPLVLVQNHFYTKW